MKMAKLGPLLKRRDFYLQRMTIIKPDSNTSFSILERITWTCTICIYFDITLIIHLKWN